MQYTVPLELAGSRSIARATQGSPLSAGLRGGKVRGLSLLAVSAGAVGMAAVEAGKERPTRGVQNPPSLPQGWGKNGS